MPKVLPEYLETRRQQIIDSAAACFARAGFHRTTMQDICSEAELSPGAVYRYFQSKEEIIQAMCSRGHEEDVETIREALKLNDTIAVMDELTRIFFSGIEDREFCALMVELISEAKHNKPIGESVLEGWYAIFEPLSDLVRLAQSRGEINPALDPRAVTRVMLGVYQGLVLQKLLDPDLDVAGYAKTTRALFQGDFWCANQRPASEAPASLQTALRH
jgi:AcrR family transcriptional regulator